MAIVKGLLILPINRQFIAILIFRKFATDIYMHYLNLFTFNIELVRVYVQFLTVIFCFIRNDKKYTNFMFLLIQKDSLYQDHHLNLLNNFVSFIVGLLSFKGFSQSFLTLICVLIAKIMAIQNRDLHYVCYQVLKDFDVYFVIFEILLSIMREHTRMTRVTIKLSNI